MFDYFKLYKFKLNILFLINSYDSTIIYKIRCNFNYHYKNYEYFDKALKLKFKSINFFYSDNRQLFNHNKIIFLNKFNKFLNNFFMNSMNFILFDKSYKNILPFYNYVYPNKNVYLYKKIFFFFDKKLFTRKNWMYFYKSFLNKFDINFFVILDFKIFRKFYKFFLSINLPIFPIVPFNFKSDFIDFPFFVNVNNISIEKFVFYNIITSIYFNVYNFNNYLNKVRYLKIFKKILKI